MGNRCNLNICISSFEDSAVNAPVMSANKQDISAIAEVPLDTGNPLGMVATLTSIAQDLTRITIDWTDIGQNGQGFFIRFYGADSEMLREWEVYGWTTEYLQMAIDTIQSQECANLILIGAAFAMAIMYLKRYFCPEAQTSFWNLFGLAKDDQE